MYLDFFGLNEKPFSIAPDPRYLYMTEQHREALAHLLFGIGDEGGFVLLTGDIGTGKTTVCRCLLNQLPENVEVAYIVNPRVSASELLESICDELAIDCTGKTTVKSLVDSLNAFLLEAHAAGRNTILIIDEAQNLADEVLEQLRLLTNLETSEKKLLQLILLGQPELNDKLAQFNLRQLAQRITARFHLRSLSYDDTESYIYHRLHVAGFRGDLFSRSALKQIHQRSKGVPRLVNVICDRSMLAAYATEQIKIEYPLVLKACDEVMGEKHPNYSIAKASGFSANGKTPYWIAFSLVILLALLTTGAMNDIAAVISESFKRWFSVDSTTTIALLPALFPKALKRTRD